MQLHSKKMMGGGGALFPEGYSSHVYCEDSRTEQADEGYRILKEA